MDNEVIEKALELEDQGELQECIKFLDENLKNIQDDLIRSDALRLLSECHLYKENPDLELSRKLAEESLRIANDNKDEKRTGESYLLLSQILNQMEDEKAEEFGRKAMDIFQKINDKENLIYSMISLATIIKDFSEASKLFEKSLKESENSNDLDMMAQAAVNYAYLLLEEKGGDEPLKVLDRAIDKIIKQGAQLKRKNERIEFVNNYSEIFDAASDIAMELDQYDLATKYASYLNKDPQEGKK
ncbi:MAG: hypothetical protein ACP5MU_00835 [Thermoplasmata archaeon]